MNREGAPFHRRNGYSSKLYAELSRFDPTTPWEVRIEHHAKNVATQSILRDQDNFKRRLFAEQWALQYHVVMVLPRVLSLRQFPVRHFRSKAVGFGVVRFQTL